MSDYKIGEEFPIRKVYGQTLVELGGLNKDIVVLDADLSGSTQTHMFGSKYPERFFNMGVSEADMMGTAAGLAASGKIPFVSTFAIFATGRAWEQVRQSIAYPHLNVKIVASHGGITVGPDGGSHQTVEDVALMRLIPGMTVIVPSDAVETRQVITTVSEYVGPVYVRLSRAKFPTLYDNSFKFEIGKGKVLREGGDVAILACGLMVSRALDAAEALKDDGISATVANISTIKPIDKELAVELADKCGAVVTVEEHSIIGGLGSAVAETLSELAPTPLKRVGVNDQFGQSGSPDELLDHYGLNAKCIAQAAKDTIERK